MKCLSSFIGSLILSMAAAVQPVSAQSSTAVGLNYPDGWAVKAPLSSKPRVIITADPELDDNNSMIRFLLFSTDYKIEGLIYSSSQFHWRGDGKGTKHWVAGREYDKPELGFKPMTHYRWDADNRFIDDCVDGYEKAYPNLIKHNPNYPTPEYVRSKVAWGNVDFDGEYSKDTPGSELIKKVLLDDEPDPVFVEAWGGCSTIARALKSIEDIYSQQPGYDALKKKVSEKCVLYLSGDQDDLYANYIKPYWPDIKQGPTGVGATNLTFFAPVMAQGIDKEILGPEWMAENISSKGYFGSIYRVWGDGKQFAKDDIYDMFGVSEQGREALLKKGYVLWCPLQPKGSFIGEGDTFCYLNLLDNGLDGYVQNWGGWSGYQDTTKVAPKTPDFLPPVMYALANRMDWALNSDFAACNHEPKIVGPTAISAAPGETVKLSYKVSDPDKGQKVTVSWWKHPSCSYAPDCNVTNPSSPVTTFTVPADAKQGDEIHLILQATDNGKVPLTHYNRLIITVQ